MSEQGKPQVLTFLRLAADKDIELGEASLVESEQDSWNVEVKTFSRGIQASNFIKTFAGAAEKEAGLREILKTFSSESGWFEYKPRQVVGSLSLLVNQNHSDFVEIAVLEDASSKSNISIRTFSQGVETKREALSFPNDSKREAARRELRETYSHANGWYLYSTSDGWDGLADKIHLPMITSYVRFVGIFQADYEFLDVSNRNEAKGRAEIEFADFSVIDKAENQVSGFGNWETQTKAVKADDGSAHMQASVKAYWWSAYHPVEAVCEDEAEQLFFAENSDRFAVVGSWDPKEFIEFSELKPQGTSTVQSATLPLHLERKLEAIEKQATSDELTIADLEWIFFGAINHQMEVFGGNLPAIDYGDAGTEFYQKWGKPNFGSEVGFYWPPNQVLSKADEGFLLDLFRRYRLLWTEEPTYDDLLSLEVGVHFELHSLRSPNVREVLTGRIQHQTWGSYSFLAAETVRLLQDAPAFQV